MGNRSFSFILEIFSEGVIIDYTKINRKERVKMQIIRVANAEEGGKKRLN